MIVTSPHVYSMQEVGEVSHVANSGRVIIRLDKELGAGQVLCDKGSTRVAKVIELIGPVARPYASAASLTNNIKRFVGRRVFVMDATSSSPRHPRQKRSSGRRSTGRRYRN